MRAADETKRQGVKETDEMEKQGREIGGREELIFKSFDCNCTASHWLKIPTPPYLIMVNICIASI